MSFWTDWSDGQKWFMGIISALVIAIAVGALNRMLNPAQSVVNSSLSRTDTGSSPNAFVANKRAAFTAEELAGRWTFEYTSGDNYLWRRRIALTKDARFMIDNPAQGGFDIFRPFESTGEWASDPRSGAVTIYLRTLIGPDGYYDPKVASYHSAVCRLLPDNDATVLQGRCLEGDYSRPLRLIRGG